MLHRAAESGKVAALEAMLGCGFDPEGKDKDSVTPLHRAAMGGHPEAVRVLLQYGANVTATDGMFAASPLVWAVEGRRHAKPGETDHVEVARPLIAAESPLGWTPPEGAPSAEGTLEGLADLRRAAGLPRARSIERRRCETRLALRPLGQQKSLLLDDQ